MGRAKAQPIVKLDPDDPHTPVLQWYEIWHGYKMCGEVLAAFELYLVSTHNSSIYTKFEEFLK